MILFFLLTWAFANKFNYQTQVLAGDKTCLEEALILKERFQIMTGNDKATSLCLGTKLVHDKKNKYSFYTLSLSTSTEGENSPSLIHTTHFGHSKLGDKLNEDYGRYKDLQSCLANLTVITNRFVALTHIPVLSSSCIAAKSDKLNSYVLNIDTIGTPKKTLHIIEDFLTPLNDNSLNQAVKNIIKEHQGQIIDHANGFYYYLSQKPIAPQRHNFGQMTESECHRQTKLIKSLFTQSEVNSPITITCTQKNPSNNELVNLIAIWNHKKNIDSLTERQAYFNSSDCFNDKEHSLEEQQTTGLNVNISICRRTEDILNDDENYYRMDLY